MLCSICNKNTAIIFTNKKDENGNTSLEGYCYNCAKEKGINPLEVLSEQSSILENDNINLDDMTSQFESIFKDLTESLTNNDFDGDLNGATPSAIPIGAIFGSVMPNNTNNDSNESQKNGSNKKVKVEKKPKQKATKYLDTFGTNLTAKARNNMLDAVIGRDKEIRKNYTNFK